MQAMVLDAPGQPLRVAEREVPAAGPPQILIQVEACGVCRTDLHVVDGELRTPKLPLVRATRSSAAWRRSARALQGSPSASASACPGSAGPTAPARYCRSGHENLCDDPRFTGYPIDGGYADTRVAEARYAFPLPEGYTDAVAAPLLCAGLIGWRSLKMAGRRRRQFALGIYGFGAAAHIVAQVATAQGREVFAFTRPGDGPAQDFARWLGAVWAGGSDETPPEPLDAAIIFAPVGELVPLALKAVRKGGAWSAAAST